MNMNMNINRHPISIDTIRYRLESGEYDKRRHHEPEFIASVRNDLEQAFEVSGHPKADLLWRMAWDRGHSSGLTDVGYAYLELVKLVK
jgi:hypothetical protein